MTDWRVYVRDRSLNIDGEIEDYSRAEFVVRDNDEGSWTVEGIPADDPLLGYLADAESLIQDAGIVLHRDGVAVFSGPIKSLTYSDGRDGRLVTISGIDDTGVLAERHILPEYTGPPYTMAYDEIGPVSAEEAMQHYVHRHAGPGATTARWVPGMTTGPFSGLGETVTKRYRFTNLLVAIQEVALAGDLRFQVVQQDNGTRTFLTYGRNDLRDLVRLSVQGGLLSSIVSSEAAPSANYVYVLGKGELESRIVVEGGDSESIARYGRVEAVIDQRQTDDAVELANALAEAIEAGREDLTVAVEPLDDEDAQMFADYFVGDQVSAITNDGRELACYVVQGTVSLLSSEGAIVTPVLATTRVAPSSRDAVRSLGQRLGHLERTNENGFSIGMVIPWMRPVSEIPAGFELADGSGGLPDLTDRYWLGAGGAFDVGDTGGLPLSGGDVTVNLQHSHAPGTLAFPHTHPHTHAPGTLTFPHTHPGSHSHGITNLSIAHTHTSQAHTHPGSHSHNMSNHNHTVDIDHDHPNQAGSTSAEATNSVQSGAGATVNPTNHTHSVNIAPLGSSPTATGNQSSGGNSTQSDSTAPAASYSGSPSAASPATVSGTSDADTSAPAASFGTASGTTASDSTAQTPGTATGTTANALSATQSVLMPLVAVLPIYRTV